MARKNIKMGPIIQLRNKDAPNTLVSLKTSPMFSYFTFAKGGYIIRISPIAKGMFVVPLEKELINIEEEGMKYPIATPIIIARNIHQVRFLSRKPRFFLSAAGAQLVADIVNFIGC
jgi:hypothetical protein